MASGLKFIAGHVLKIATRRVDLETLKHRMIYLKHVLIKLFYLIWCPTEAPGTCVIIEVSAAGLAVKKVNYYCFAKLKRLTILARAMVHELISAN